MKVYLDGVELTSAFDIRPTPTENAISQATFKVPNVHTVDDLTEYKAWQERIDVVEVIIKVGAITLFIGTVYAIDNSTPLVIHCEDSGGKLTWYSVPATSSDFLKFEGKVAVAPVNYNLELFDKIDEDPGFSNDDHNGNYAIVSDSTKGTLNKTFRNPVDDDGAPDPDFAGFGESYNQFYNDGGDYKDVLFEPDDTNFLTGKVSMIDLLNGRFFINLNLGDTVSNQIPRDSVIHKLVINARFKLLSTNAYGEDPYFENVYFIMSTGPTHALYNHLRTYSLEVKSGATFKVQSVVDLEVAIGDSWARYFTKGATFYEGGFIGFRVVGGPGKLGTIAVHWDSLEIKVYYDNETFDVINVPITDTVATDTITSATDFAAEGVDVDDSVYIGSSMDSAYLNCYHGVQGTPVGLPNLYINNGVSISKGLAQRYLAYSGYRLFQTLNSLNLFKYFIKYGIGTVGTLWAITEADKLAEADLDGGVLTGFAPVPNLETQNNRFGTVECWWSGQSEGDNPVSVSTGNGNPKTKRVIRRDILTYTEALNIATEEALLVADYHYSFALRWSTFIHIQVGHYYEFDLFGENYPDMICRRVENIYSLGSYSITAYLGGGNTKATEKIGMLIGNLDRRLNIADSLTLSYGNIPVNHWLQIAGKPSTFTPSAHQSNHVEGGSDEFTATLPAVSSPYYVVRNANDESTGYLTAPTIGMVSDVFTITAPFSFYQKGIKYDYAVDGTIDLSVFSTFDTIFIYYDASRVLTASTTPWVFGSGYVFTGVVYKQAADYRPFKEQHGLMPHQMHEELHNTIGPLYMNGFDVVATDIDLECTEGYYYDEDIKHTITAADPKQVHVVYRDGANFIVDAASNLWNKQNVGQVRYDNAGVLADVSTNDYVSYWLYMSPDNDNLPYCVVGQSYHNKSLGAIADSPNDLILPAFFIEFSLAYHFIVNGNGSLVDTIDMRRPPRGAAGAPVITSHNTLADRFVDFTHKDENVATDYEQFDNILNVIGNENVEDALILIDTELKTEAQIQVLIDAVISDAVYSQANWDNITDVAPSQNAVFDKMDKVDDNISALAGANTYKGLWDASTGSYPATPTNGDWWRVGTAGTTNNFYYNVWDMIVWNGTIWERVILTNPEHVISVSTQDSIQEAIDSLNDIGGGILFIEEGTHNNSTDTFPLTINMPGDKLTIYGVGDLSVIDPNATAVNIFEITNASEVLMRDFKILANDLTSTTARIISCVDANDHPILLERLTIVGGNDFGLGVYINSSNITVQHCEISDCYNAIYSAPEIHSGISIFNNYFHSADGTVLYLRHVYSTNATFIKNNRIEGTSAYTTYAIICQTEFTQFIGNSIVGAFGRGLQLVAAARSSIITNNLFSGFTTTSICPIAIMLFGADYCIVSNNVVEDFEGDVASEAVGAIHLSSQADANIISNNKFINITNLDAGYDHNGIYISSDSDDNLVYGNSFTTVDVNIVDLGTDNEQYYTQTEIDATFSTHASSSDHDARYYTESEVDALLIPDYVELALSSDQSVSNATVSTVYWHTERSDTSGYHDSSSNAERITIPSGKEGKFLITLQLTFYNDGTTGDRIVYIYKNLAVGVVRFGLKPISTTAIIITTQMTLSAGDYIYCRCYQNSGGAINLHAAAGIYECHWKMTRISD